MKNLFIEGPSRYGKTTTILRILGPERIKTAGGFLTLRLRYEDNSDAGFRVIKAGEATESSEVFTPEADNIFIKITPEGRTKDETVFAAFVKGILDNPGREPFLLMDEIGGVELLDDAFMEKLKQVLEGPIPIIGTLKCRENAERMAANLELSGEYLNIYDEFRRWLIESTHSVSIDIRTLAYAGTEDIIRDWMKYNNLE